MNYAEAIQFLYDLNLFGANFGLETPRKLAELSGNPQNKLRFIHVAGTNGKGSTCAMLESIYRAAGLRVGLFTSPHLVSFRERIQINRKLIGESDVAKLVGEIQPSLAEFQKEHPPTFFEVVTIMALRYFAEQKCELVILETGLGGRLDATNIVTPLASVITNIQFDHQQWLGDTIEKIAAEKAGIIKPNIPVIITVDEPEAFAVIGQIAKTNNASLTRAMKNHVNVSLSGEHQRLNAALAVSTVNVLQKQIPVSEEQIRAGLSQVNWQGRLQLVQRTSGQKILLDGAHNIASAEILRTALRESFYDERPVLVLGILQDKDWRQMCEILAPLASSIFIVPVNSNRTASPQELAEVCRRENSAGQVSVCSSLAEALEKTTDEKFVVITGSLYLVGEAMELLGLVAGANERGLNEWTADKAL